jgi:prolyl-tRNA synthetase
MMGGSGAHEYLAPCEAGENEVALCSTSDYAANVEVATSAPSTPDFGPARDSPEEVDTPGVTTIEALAGFLSVDPRTTSKAMPVVRLSDGELVLGLVRGDHRLHELKMAKALGSEFRPAHAEEIRDAFGADGGSLGPVGISLPVIADESLQAGQYVAGANTNGRHLLGVQAGRDFEATFADIREVETGDACVRCGGELRVTPAIEVGNIFKLGTRYSVPLGATYLDESGVDHPIVMGSYGIGPARTMAAIIEQNHDEHGIVWPPEASPFDVEIVAIGAAGPEALATAELLAGELEAAGLSVLLDDRDRRPGEKFADADLIGCPIRLTVGKKTLEDGQVDMLVRDGRAEERIPAAHVVTRVATLP